MPNNSKINLQTGRPNETTSRPQAVEVNSEIDKAQRLLEELRLKKEEQERKEAQLELVAKRRQEFEANRTEVLSKLTEAMPLIEQELLKSKQEISDLEQARKHFQVSLKNIESINPSRWENDDVLGNADKYENFLFKTAREHESFATMLKGSRNTSPLHAIVSSTGSPLRLFGKDVLRGFAFSLPLIVALTVLLITFKG